MSSIVAGAREIKAFFGQDARSRTIGFIMWTAVSTAFTGGMLVGMLLVAVVHG